MKVGPYVAVVSLLFLSAGSGLAQEKQQAQVAPVETLQQANQKLDLLAQSAEMMQLGTSTLIPGDMIKVNVFDIPELSEQVRLDSDGYISMPLVPQRIKAAGMTAPQLESKIADLLKSNGLVSQPQVTVFVVERIGQPITVIGAVEHPMVYQAVRPTTLLEVLSAAGGLSDTAADYVTVSRMGKDGTPEVKRVDLRDLIDRGDPTANVLLQANDVVTVPRAGIVYVVGAVAHPGGFVIQNDTGQMTTLKALALAGGTQSTAKTQDAVIIRKDSAAGKNDEIPVDLKKVLSQKTQDVQLRPNDILFIPDSASKKALAKVADTALSITTGITIVRAGSF